MTRKLLIGIGALGILAAACGVIGSQEGAEEAAPAAAPAPESAPAEVGEAEITGGEAFDVGATEGGGAVSRLPVIGPTVVKTADIQLEVRRFKVALQSATQVATAHGGFVVSSLLEGEEAKRGTLVIRVPAEQFEQALNSLRDLGKVKSDTVSTQDVSQEFVDLEARQRNLEAQEAVLLRLMDQSKTVSDAIKVQRELTGVQLEIEQITGRLRFLEDQTTFGTISVAISEPGVVAPPKPGALQRGWERATDGFLAIVSGAIAVSGVALPLTFAALIVWIVVRRVRPRPVRTP